MAADQSDHDNAVGSAKEKTTGRVSSGREKPRWNPPLLVWSFIAFTILVIAVVHSTDVMADHALSNVVTGTAIFLALIVWISWFSLYSQHALWVRVLPFVLFVFAATTFFVFYRVDHVSGELVPVFARRFSFHPDQLLSLPNQRQTPSANRAPDLAHQTPDDFPQFLGPNRAATIDTVELTEEWETSKPKEVWRKSIGAGWSAFSAVNGYAVTMEQRGPTELTTCYDLETGDILWSHVTPARYQNKLGGIGPRSTPTIHKGRVYSLGVTGQLHCLDGSSGKVLWGRDLPVEFGSSAAEDAELVYYGRSNSPLIVDELVVIPAGGTEEKGLHSLVAYDWKTGEEMWRGGDTQISYSSPSLVEICGMRQILSVNEQTVSGHDPSNGKTIWSHPWPGNNLSNSNSSQAVVIGPDKVLLSKGYGNGAMLLQITRSDSDQWAVEKIWKKHNVLRTKFTNVVVKGEHTFGLSDGILQCIETATGRIRWKKGRYGHGQILLVGDKILVLAENGTVYLVTADPKRHQELGRFKAIEGTSWNNLCLYGPYLLVRNAQEVACFKLPIEKRSKK